MNNNKILILGIIVGILLVYLINNLINKIYVPDNLNNVIQILVRQAARWSTAAEQDNNTMIAILHANYGAGYLWALKDIATDNEIETVSGINMKKFTYKILQVQDNATKEMAKLCPKFAPKKTYLTKIGGEGI